MPHQPRPSASAAIAAASLIAAACPAALAGELTLTPAADATLYENSFGDTANGSGDAFFIGKNNSNFIYRGLLRFDFSAIPDGATIESASLTLYCNRTLAGSEPATLHRVLADWGEGPSIATGNGGAGAPAQKDDATWLYRFFVPPFGAGSPAWDNAGGDFEPTPSATTSIAGEAQFYTFDDPGLAADIQAFADGSLDNFGWMLRGREGSGGRSSKRIESKDSDSPAFHPKLTVTFSAGGGCTDADIAQPFGVLDLTDVQAFVDGFIAQDPIADIAPPQGVFDLADIQAFIASFNAGCP
jgi:hypothetical protein